MFGADAGEHFGQPTRGRHGGRRGVAARAMVMADRSDAPGDGRRVEPRRRLVAGEHGDDVGAGGQRGEAMRGAPGGEDRPVGIIHPPRRARPRRLGVGGGPLDLFVEDRGQRRLGRRDRERDRQESIARAIVRIDQRGEHGHGTVWHVRFCSTSTVSENHGYRTYGCDRGADLQGSTWTASAATARLFKKTGLVRAAQFDC
jgi:hypothetical protein